jgi:hypothetical protein
MSAAAAKEPSTSKGRGRLFEMLAFAIVALGVVALVNVQPMVAAQLKNAKSRDEVSALPPPKQLKVMAFGYKQSTVDLLWAKLIVEWGMAHIEKRPFPALRRYIDAIIEIEPDFPTLYTFVDTLLVYGPTVGTADDARDARKYLKRGTEERKYDHEVWLHYGQFCAFLAPSFLTDPKEIDEFRKEGAFALIRYVELGGDPDRSLSANTILKKSGGEKTARRSALRRAIALADDPETRRNLLAQLAQLEDTPAGEEDVEVFEREWRRRFPFLSRSAVLLVGPGRAQQACVGLDSFDEKRCPRDWTTFIRTQR